LFEAGPARRNSTVACRSSAASVSCNAIAGVRQPYPSTLTQWYEALLEEMQTDERWPPQPHQTRMSPNAKMPKWNKSGRALPKCRPCAKTFITVRSYEIMNGIGIKPKITSQFLNLLQNTSGPRNSAWPESIKYEWWKSGYRTWFRDWSLPTRSLMPKRWSNSTFSHWRVALCGGALKYRPSDVIGRLQLGPIEGPFGNGSIPAPTTPAA